MPDFIHNPAALFPNLVQEAMAKKCANESQLMQILWDEHKSKLASQPEIEKRLWNVDEYVEHVACCDMNRCSFIKDYFGEGGLCNKRVLEIRELLDKVWSTQTYQSKIAKHVPKPNPVVESIDKTAAADIGSTSPKGVHNVTSTPSPCHAGRPDSLEFMKQPSSCSVSPNNTMAPVTRHMDYVQSYLNSSIAAKKTHVQDLQVCSQNNSWDKSSPCHASNEKFSPPLPVCNAKNADP